MRSAFCRLLSVALICLIASGCGGSSGPKMYPVTGKVTYQDKPVAKANVMFTPEIGTPAMGKTGTDGTFSLSTNGVNGAMPGKGVWTITAFEDFEKPPEMTPDEAGKLAQQGKLPVVKAKSIIPEKYGTTVTSGLNFEVSNDSSKNNFDFKLTD